MEETQKLVEALVGQKNEGPRKGGASDMEDRGSEGSLKSKGKSPEQNEEGRAGGPGFGSGGWVFADSGTPMLGTGMGDDDSRCRSSTEKILTIGYLEQRGILA